jgi:hypothetical protein
VIPAFLKYQKTPLLFGVLLSLFYLSFAYDLDRGDFTKLILLYTASFLISYKLIEIGKSNFLLLGGIAIGLRLLFLPAIPNLSQDFYRFIWDGRMLLQGFNPYLTTPESFMIAQEYDIVHQSRTLVQGMGALNASNYTNYPPINQFLFAIAAFLSGKSITTSVVVLRVIIILADIGILIYGRKLLQKLKLPEYQVFWYVLNPFIIIEMTGNLHFESVMLFFLVMALYLLLCRRWIWSSIFFAFSISVKLIPLMLLPLAFQFLLSDRSSDFRYGQLLHRPQLIIKRIPRLIAFYGLTLGVVVVSFFPFLEGQFYDNFGASVALWFEKFEFNASIYYIIRYIGFQTIGWNIIADVGKILPLIVTGIILVIAFFRKNSDALAMISAMLLSISVYFLLSTTVHPWYIATPLLLGIFTRYRFPMLWSLMVFLSYSAYGNDGFKEHLGLIALEYLVVIGLAIYEMSYPKRRPIF